MKNVISFVVMSVLMAACGHSPVQPTPVANPPAPSATYSVAGTVFESTGDGARGVADAQIVFGSDLQTLTAATDDNGGFSLEGIKAGTWQLSVSKEGYETLTMMVEVPANQSVDVELKVVTNQ